MEASETLVSASTNTLRYLPSEIITDILSRLPVETLLRFKCVCKTWHSVISSTHFSKTHHKFSRNSKNYANHSLILNLHNEQFCTIKCSLTSILNNNAHFKPLYSPAPKRDHPGREDGIRGNCNGLLCVHFDSKLVLYNPATRKLKRLPDSGYERYPTTYGLCYNELDDDYRVVQLYTFGKHDVYGVNIYSLRTNSWRKINDVFDCSDYNGVICLMNGLAVGGLLHWPIRLSSCQIFLVDTVTYTHGTLSGPKSDIKNGYMDFDVMDFAGFLGVYYTFSQSRLDIWMMKGSWTKVVTLPYQVRGWTTPLVGFKDGEILFRTVSGYSICNSREKSLIKQVIGGFYYSIPLVPSPVYIESLVAPSFDGEL